MDIQVIGSGKLKRAKAQSIAEYCIEKLLPRTQNLDVIIYLIPNLNSKAGVQGDCLATDTINNPPREFDIRINSTQPLKAMLSTVAHELVHVKQFAKGELYDSTVTNKTRWHGQWLKRTPEYWDLPWEIEAYGREVGLFVRWAEENGYANQKWTQD